MDFATFTLAFVLTAVVVALFAWSALRPYAARAGTLVYSEAVRRFWVVLSVFAFGALLNVVRLDVRDGRLALHWQGLVLGFVLCVAITVPIAIEFFKVQHRYDEYGVVYSTPWTGSRNLPWSQVREVRFRPLAQWLDLTGADGRVHHFSTMLAGRELFARVLLKQLPEGVLDAATRAVVQRMADGAM